MEEGPSNTKQQWRLFQELGLGTVEERQYNCLNKKDSSAKDKAGRGEYSRRNDTMYTMYIYVWRSESLSVNPNLIRYKPL